MCRIFRDYLELARKYTVLIDVACAVILSFGITFFISLSNIASNELVNKIIDFTKIVIPTFAIQAGFHGTSLSIFSSSNTGMAKYLKETRIENTNRRLIEQIYACFSWSVVVQLCLLFYAIIIYYFVSYLPVGCMGATLPWYLGGSLLVGGLYALLLTLRNVGILYLFLVSSARHFNSEE
jgi:hypothetical protein